MKKHYFFIALLLAKTFVLGACGSSSSPKEENNNTEAANETDNSKETKIVTYLGKDYEVPVDPQKILVVAPEGMEELEKLGVKPYAVGKDVYDEKDIPEEMAKMFENVEYIDVGYYPDKEALLELSPDLILSTNRLAPEELKPMEEIAPTFPLSYDGADTIANITVVGEILNKQDEASQAIKEYEEKLAAAKEKIANSDLKDKIVLYMRLSSSNGITIYNDSITYNSILYNELGFKAPEVLTKVERLEEFPLEKLAELNPDYIFVLMYETETGTDKEDKAYEELAKNPLWQKIAAVQNDNVSMNIISPYYFGVPVFSKELFLDKAMEVFEEDMK